MPLTSISTASTFAPGVKSAPQASRTTNIKRQAPHTASDPFKDNLTILLANVKRVGTGSKIHLRLEDYKTYGNRDKNKLEDILMEYQSTTEYAHKSHEIIKAFENTLKHTTATLKRKQSSEK